MPCCLGFSALREHIPITSSSCIEERLASESVADILNVAAFRNQQYYRSVRSDTQR